jgi:hypothetical protein
MPQVGNSSTFAQQETGFKHYSTGQRVTITDSSNALYDVLLATALAG